MNDLFKVMPDIVRHQGVWLGEYQVIDLAGNLIDQHSSRVECVFPEHGEVVYRQNNSFSWQDGRQLEMSFDGILQGDKIYWDTPTFHGYGWLVNESVFMLELARKDVIGASFTEMIVLGHSGKHRARTWHWFKDGRCYQRTLCNEMLA